MSNTEEMTKCYDVITLGHLFRWVGFSEEVSFKLK